MLDGYEQITLPSGVVEHKYSVGDAIITKRSNGANETYYLHKDQQGSTTAITNASGVTVQQLMYDPWGKQYVVNTGLLTYTSPAISKGYTGHEMVNDFEVIHMGGRTYNPTLGRFMQADPFIQSPTNLQSYNRYSYVLNNPMSYTDPSGYFFKKLFSSIAKVPWLSTVISAAMTIFIPGCQTGVCAAAFNAAMTYSLTGSLRAAGIGFIAGIASGGGILNDALIGGVASVLQGGKFGRGFVSAGLGNMAGNAAGGFKGNAFAKVLVAGVLGGTVSKITGDKFANGAFGAAFAAALRSGFESSKRSREHKLNSDEDPAELDAELSAQDLKAKEALRIANPKSIEDNLEYGGVIYKLDGEYHYTNPLPGTDQGFDLSNALALVPEGAIVVGDYHTHADYSLYNSDTGRAIRTSDPLRDDFNSDHFSTPDLRGIRSDAGIGGVYRGYLGTPSGRLKAFNPYNNTVYTLGGG